MKQLPRRESMQYYIGICFLLLLSSQEVISVNERIEHGVKGQMSMNLMGKAKQMLRQMEVAFSHYSHVADEAAERNFIKK